MRKTILLLLTLVLLTGCPDPEAERKQDLEVQFEKAVAQFRKVRRDYADPVPKAEKVKHVRDFVAEELVIAEKVLSAFPVAEASDSQAASINRMLADVYAAQAWAKVRRAKAAWASVELQGAKLNHDMRTIQRIEARARLADNREPGILPKLRDDQLATERRLDQLNTDEKELADKIADLEGQVAQLDNERQKLLSDALEKQQQADTSKDADERLKLGQAVVELRHQAESRTNRMQGLREVKLSVFRAEHASVAHQRDLAKAALEAINVQVAAAQKRDDELATVRKEANAERTATSNRLYQDFKKIVDDYVGGSEKPPTVDAQSVEGVEQMMDEAAALLTKSIEKLQAAKRKSKDSNVIRSVSTELVVRQSELAQILSDHVVYAGNFGAIIGSLHTQGQQYLAPERVNDIGDQYNRRYEKQQKLRDEADKAIEDADGAADASGDSVLISEREQALSSYRFRLDDPATQLTAKPSGPRTSLRPPRPTPTPTPGTGDQPPTGGDVVEPSSVVVTGDWPAALPEVMYQTNHPMIVQVDLRHFNPKAVDTTIKSFLGPAAAQMGEAMAGPMTTFNGFYEELAAAGAVGFTLVISEEALQSEGGAGPGDAPVYLLVATGQGADPEKILAAMGNLDGGPQADDTKYKVDGQWIIYHPAEITVPAAAADPEARQSMQDALSKVSGKSIGVVVMNTDSVRKLMSEGAGEEAEPNPMLTALTKTFENSKWYSTAVRLGDNPGFDMIVKAASADEATQAKTTLDQMLEGVIEQMQAPPDAAGAGDGPDPMAMVAQLVKPEMIREAIKSGAQGDELTLTVNLNPLKPAVGPLMGLIMMMQAAGGGEGGGFGPPDDSGFGPPGDGGFGPGFDPSK